MSVVPCPVFSTSGHSSQLCFQLPRSALPPPRFWAGFPSPSLHSGGKERGRLGIRVQTSLRGFVGRPPEVMNRDLRQQFAFPRVCSTVPMSSICWLPAALLCVQTLWPPKKSLRQSRWREMSPLMGSNGLAVFSHLDWGLENLRSVFCLLQPSEFLWPLLGEQGRSL